MGYPWEPMGKHIHRDGYNGWVFKNSLLLGCLPTFRVLSTFRVSAYLSGVCLPFGCLFYWQVCTWPSVGPRGPMGPWGPYKKKVCVVKIGAQTEKNNTNLIFVLHISLKLTFSTDDKHFLCCI